MEKLFFILLLFISFHSVSQNQPPVSAELLLGEKRTSMLVTMNRKISGDFKYMNITSTTANYDLDKGRAELVMINSAIYQFHKIFGVSAGLQYHFLKGLVPSVAFHTSYADPVWMFMFIPFLNFRPETNSENVMIVEYKPQLNDSFKLYTHIMGLYNHNVTLKSHDRSFYQLRLGVTYRNFTFGAGANLDYYGAKKINENTYGAFLKIDV